MKRIVPILLALCLIFGLTGCAPNLAGTSWVLVYADIYGMPFDDETMESVFGRLIYIFNDDKNITVRQDGADSPATYTQKGGTLYIVTEKNEFEAQIEGNVMTISAIRITEDGEIQFTMKFQKVV